jgi:hypothetical protein
MIMPIAEDAVLVSAMEKHAVMGNLSIYKPMRKIADFVTLLAQDPRSAYQENVKQ